MNYVIMPVVCGMGMTNRCLASIVEQDIGNVVPVVIDNGSQDGVGHYLRSLQGIVLMSYPRARSLNYVWNKALRWVFEQQDQDHVLVVNNDTVLRQDTYRLLLADGGPFVTAIGQAEPARYSDDFMLGQDRVKISHFTQQGLKVTGVVHVGANDGYEIEWYRKMGAKVMAFEPLTKACELAWAKYGDDPEVSIFPFGLSDAKAILRLNVTRGDGQGSSFLREYNGPYEIEEHQQAEVRRFDQLGLSLDGYNTLVVDTQGMELHVLRGFGEQLKQFQFLNIECSRVPLYEGGHSAQEVIDFLASQGFDQDSPIEDHNDIMFIRRDVQRLAATRRPHPDFSCFMMRRNTWERVGPFDESFWVYSSDGDMHLRMHQAGIAAVSISVPFEHIASGTLKQVDDATREFICHKSDEDREMFRKKWGCSVGSPEYYQMFRK